MGIDLLQTGRAGTKYVASLKFDAKLVCVVDARIADVRRAVGPACDQV